MRGPLLWWGDGLVGVGRGLVWDILRMSLHDWGMLAGCVGWCGAWEGVVLLFRYVGERGAKRRWLTVVRRGWRSHVRLG